MKALRLVTNSLLAGLYFALLMALLVLDLNINLTFSVAAWLRLTLFLMITYGLLAALVILSIAAIFRFLTGRKTPLNFVSLPFLTLACSFLTLIFLVIFRENYLYFISFFVPGLQAPLRTQMLALFLLSISGFVLHYRQHHLRPQRPYAGVFFGLLASVLVLAAVQRLGYPAPQKSFKLANLEAKSLDKRVTVLCLEGLSLDLLLPYTGARKLPNFGWLMKEGAWGRLDGFTPSDPYILTATFNTGKLPGKHRLISDVKYQIPGLGTDLEVVPRFILFRQMKRLGLMRILPNDAKPRTKDIWTVLAEYKAPAVRMNGPFIAPSIARKIDPRSDKLFRSVFQDFQSESSWIFAQVKQAFLRDAGSEEQAFQAKSDIQPRLFSLLLDGATTAEMYFYKYSFPGEFGEIREDEIQKYGSVIEKYYFYYDQIISKYLASLKEGELFIVYSPHGTESLPFWKRVVEWTLGNSEVSAYHEQAPPGVAFVYGKGIIKGWNFDAIRLVDLAPTILYYLGLPVGKDMDGVVRGSLFERAFADENPVLTITSYDDVGIKK